MVARYVRRGRVRLIRGDFGHWLLEGPGGRELLFQTDWDRAPLASLFGWSPCKCGRTDGTVDCSLCCRTVGDMLAEADDFLEAHVGKTAPDPGYFD